MYNLRLKNERIDPWQDWSDHEQPLGITINIAFR